MGSLPHNHDVLDLFSDLKFTQKKGCLGAEDVELVPHGSADLLRAARVRLACRVHCLPHREELHAEREGCLLCLRTPQELPKLCLAGVGVNVLGDHVPQCPQASQSLAEGLQGPNSRAPWGNRMAPQDCVCQGIFLDLCLVFLFGDKIIILNLLAETNSHSPHSRDVK